MELRKIIEEHEMVMDTISKEVNIPKTSVIEVVSEITPTLVSSIRQQAKNESEIDMFFDEMEDEHFEDLLVHPEHIPDEEFTIKGNVILEHILKSKEVSRVVAELVSQKSGVSESTVRKMLPMIASIMVGIILRMKHGWTDSDLSKEELMHFLDESMHDTMWDEVINRSKWAWDNEDTL